jgi:dUTP pyrophosphatase
MYKGAMDKTVQVACRKLSHFRGDLPMYASEFASGCDVRAQLGKTLILAPGERALVPTGLAFAVPPGLEIQVRPRSGWAAKRGVTVVNSPGTVDADYRGEILVALVNLGSEPVEILDQDRVAQLVLCPVLKAEFQVVDELPASVRGEGGFGSTGFSV